MLITYYIIYYNKYFLIFIFYTELEIFIKRYKTDLDSAVFEPTVFPLVNPGLRLKNSESTLSLPLSSENITTLKEYSYNTTEVQPHYWISNEIIEIENNSFTTLVERDIKKDVVKCFCKNLNEIEFEMRLLGVRFCDSSCFIDQSGQVSTEPVVLQPSSVDVASQRDGFEDFCATVCIQVIAIFFFFCFTHHYLFHL